MEITCPKCGFARNIPDEKIPERAEIATCPKCKHKFQFRTVTQSVPPPPLLSDTPPEEHHSQAENDRPQGDDDTSAKPMRSEKPSSDGGDFWDSLASMGTPNQDTQHPGETEDTTEGVTREGEIEVPWERLDIYGFFPGIWETIKRAMLRPAAFFQAMPVGSGQIKPLIFYLLIAQFQIVVQMLWEMTGVAPGMSGEGSVTGISTVMLLIGYPLILTLLLYVMAVLVHACLGLVGGATREFEGTFRALTYGSAPMVLTLIPFIGPLVGAIWSLVVTFLGYKYIHRTTTGKVILAMLLPLIPFVFVLALVMSMAQRSAVPTF
ncbi:YIP1 family protein [Desulfonatronum thioautotrophicum]|uniref:YIP1 family protein n=1 Tax=Desulfonatronum thioautotrophicum TaxID=617001 RepID=UPI0005EAD66C|nr:YIP1 family protein [Desulfonatronum thioautotrophicum]